jgi:serine/threonine protein kinase
MIDTGGVEVERSAPMSSPEGTRQLGRYQLLRHLATGGMAEIWLAGLDTSRKHESGPFRFSCPTHAVIKVIAPERAKDRQFVQMFLDEARVAATLYHPHIAQLYEVGYEDQTYFHAMEFVHGENVRAVVERSIIVRQPTPLAATVAIGRAIAAALHYAHERKGATGEPLDIVHRDVTPSNIMIGWDGGVKLVDFGVALAAGRAAQTRTGVVKGKLAYMSPEQCRGVRVDRRTDVFALGVVLYEVSLQRRAFRGDSEYQTMERIVRGDLAPPSQVMPGYPPALEQIIQRAMSTDLTQRYATAAEMGAALEQFARAEGLPDGKGVMKEHMRAIYGEAPAPGVPVAPVTLALESLRAPSVESSGSTSDTHESPAALAAAAMAPRVATNVMVPTGPMPVVAGPSPTGAMNAQRPMQFPFGTQPMKPTAVGSETLGGGALASRAAVASGVAARSGTRAVSVAEAPRSRAPWIIAGAVLLAGVSVAAVIVMTSGDAKRETGAAAPAVAAPAAAAATETETETEPETATGTGAAVSTTITLTITAPDGPAEVSVDGTRVGTTPYAHPLERGRARHKIEIRRSGFATFRKTITADEDQAIEAILVPRSARTAAPSPPPPAATPPAGVGSGSASTNDDLSGARY